MFTVRFPNGQAIQYNSANYLTYEVTGWHLYEKQGGRWVATIQPSAGAIIEAVPACRVYEGVKSELSIAVNNRLLSFERKLGRALAKVARQTPTNTQKPKSAR